MNAARTALTLCLALFALSVSAADPAADRALLDVLQRDAFRSFWEDADPRSGMAHEADYGWDVRPAAAGGTGFAAAATVVAADRGWVTREQALARLLKITEFLRGETQRKEMHGAFPHWIDGATGKAMEFGGRDAGADIVETSLLMQGLLIARAYFNGPGVEEKLRGVITELWEDVEWDFFGNGEENGLYWHWDTERGFFNGLKILGYNECLVTYVLAAASPTHPISRKTCDYWTSGVDYLPRDVAGYAIEGSPSGGGPLFLSQYSFVGLDPRRLADDSVKRGYFVRNVSQTLSNRAYCLYEAPPENRYAADFWGLSAGHAPDGYTAASPANDAGTVSPSGAISSMPYAPQYAMEVLENLAGPLRKRAWGDFGPRGGVSLRDDWVAPHYLAIDQLPMTCMVENYRTGLLWSLFMSDPDVKRGLQTAGLREPEHEEGFPEAIVALRPAYDGATGRRTGAYVPDAHDSRRRPDTGLYEIPYWTAAAGPVGFRITFAEGGEESVLFTRKTAAPAGRNTLAFPWTLPLTGEILTLRMKTAAGEYSLPLRLH